MGVGALTSAVGAAPTILLAPSGSAPVPSAPPPPAPGPAATSTESVTHQISLLDPPLRLLDMHLSVTCFRRHQQPPLHAALQRLRGMHSVTIRSSYVYWVTKACCLIPEEAYGHETA